MENKMFCYQCEQTAGCTGCTGNAGVCGKSANTARLQDELTGALIGLARAAEGNEHLVNEEMNQLVLEGLFTTVTNVNFNDETLFHGLTKEEKIANTEKAVEESLKKEETSEMTTTTDAYVRKHELAKALRETKGHPLYSFTEANEKFSKEIADIRGALEKGEDVSKKISDFRQIAIHYAKKGDLIYPLLKVRYEISGPSYVMWSVDDEIRDELAAIDKECNHDEEWIKRVQAVLTRADEMIYKETNILFPICAMNFTAEEWYEIYEDAKDYALVYGIDNRWEEAEKYVQDKKNRHEAAIYEGEIVMGGGHMSAAQLEAMLNTLPIEITFIDDNNINRFFNEGAKVFKRPGMAIDREVFSCHPPKIEPMVRSIIESFKIILVIAFRFGWKSRENHF